MRIKIMLAVILLAAAAPVQAAWQEASSQHFLVYSDDSPEHVKAFAAKLERFDKGLRRALGAPDPATSPMTRITVFVVPSIGAVQKLAGKRNGSVAGFYVPRASQSVAFVPRNTSDSDFSSMVVLLHEYSHHLMFSSYGEAVFPAWLIEGFAELYATARFNDDGGILFGEAPQYRAYGILDYETMPLAKLLTVDPNTLKDDRTKATFYARAWLLMDYMSLDLARRKQLGAYMRAVNDGQAIAESTKLLGDPQKLDGLLNRYAAQPHLLGFTIKAENLAIGPVGVRALSAAEAAIMPARIASARGVDRSTAAGVATIARKAAALYPDDPAVQDVLAETEHDAGNWAASQAAADRVLAANPTSIHALIYQGMSRAGALLEAKSVDHTQWAAVRATYRKANRLDPEYALPLELYYQSFIAAKEAPTANAQAGLLYAHVLAPFDVDLGMTAAYVLLQQGKGGAAKAVLKPIAYNPHNGDYAQAASALIATIEKDGDTAALAVMERQIDAANSGHPVSMNGK